MESSKRPLRLYQDGGHFRHLADLYEKNELTSAINRVMDEATSALDVETERNVLRNILQKAPGRTFIITTHRPTMLSMCDRVYRVVDKRITRLGQEEINSIVRNF